MEKLKFCSLNGPCETCSFRKECTEFGIYGGKRIAVVDSEVKIREIISGILRSAGFDVYETDSGIDALTENSVRKFDMVLIDWEMSTERDSVWEMDSLKIVIISKQKVDFNFDFDGFILKPFCLMGLLKKVFLVMGEDNGNS